MKTSRHGQHEYHETLNNHKELIKNNRYARELEQRYHKVKHQSFKDPFRLTHSFAHTKSPVWPIDSQAFTNILRSKLQDAPNNVYLNPKSHIRIMSEFQKLPKTNMADGSDLPDIHKGRYWSPPKLDQNISLLTQQNFNKVLAPKVRRVW